MEARRRRGRRRISCQRSASPTQGRRRSLRSSSSLATVMVFIDDDTYNKINLFTKNLLSNCGLEFIKIGKITNYFKNNIVNARYFLYSIFLEYFSIYFERIIICDIYDTIFQNDPFSIYFDRSSIGLTHECFFIESSTTQLNWMKMHDSNWNFQDLEYRKIIKSKIINGGIIYATPQMLRVFLRYTITFPLWNNISTEIMNDQGLININYYKNVYQKNHLNIKLDPKRYISSVRGCMFKREKQENEIWTLNRLNISPALIHQYNRICPILEWIKKVCSVLSSDHISPYPKENDITQTCNFCLNEIENN